MLDDFQDLIEELLGTPKIVRAALASSDPDVMRIVSAMAARDALVLERIQSIKNRLDPHLKTMPSAASLEESAPDIDPESLMNEFDTGRGELVSLLMNLTLLVCNGTATTENDGI